MASFPNASQAADEFLPPNNGTNTTNQAYQKGVTTAVTTAAQAVDLLATLNTNNGNPIAGGFFVTFQARGSNVYMRCGPATSTGTTAGAASNGIRLTDGEIRSFWITPATRFADIIGDAACSLFWYASSRNYAQPDAKVAGNPA